MALYGDLDLSVLDELPPGRTPVKTVLRTPGQRDGVYEFVASEVEQGRQAYIVYPLVEESEKVDLLAAHRRVRAAPDGCLSGAEGGPGTTASSRARTRTR